MDTVFVGKRWGLTALVVILRLGSIWCFKYGGIIEWCKGAVWLKAHGMPVCPVSRFAGTVCVLVL